MSFDWKIDMEEFQVVEVRRFLGSVALSLLIAVSGAAQEASTKAEKSGKSTEEEQKAAQAEQKAAESGKTVDTRPKIVYRPENTRTKSPLVEAANNAKANRQKARIVLDNDDVKKSTGKITVLKERPEIEVPEEGTREKLEKEKKALDAMRKQASDRVENARKTVDEIEKELAKLEDDYYTESDLDYRDDVIEQRFNETKEQLDKAREELSSAREELQKAELTHYAPAAETAEPPTVKPPQD
ncbi:MAG TPA: hypothetical protein VIL97_05260 [Thermoanaerobaculia bacterium]